MSVPDSAWLTAGQGDAPELSWAFATDAPLADLQFARENGDALAADVSGGLYRLNRSGRVESISRGFKNASRLAWSDAGTIGAAILHETELVCFDPQLQTRWKKHLPGNGLALAIDPFGHCLAVGLDSSLTLVLGKDKQLITEFESIRPLRFLRFVATFRDIIGAADHGVILRQHYDGASVWAVRVLHIIGDLAITGNGQLAYLAGFDHGIHVFDAEGNNHATYVVGGCPSRISTSFDGKMIVAATQENYLYRLNPRGELVWAAEAPDVIKSLHADPLGKGFVCGFASGRIARFDWADE